MRRFNKYKVLSIISVSVFTLLSVSNSVFAENIPDSAKEAKALSEETKIPVINLLTAEGKQFDLNKSVSEKPTLLIFYRGGWCPYCNVQLSKLNLIEKELLEMGFQIIAISPDKPEKLKESIDKHKLTYLLLSDSKMEAAKAFGIAFKVDNVTLFTYKTFGIDLKKASGEEHQLLPVPSVFIINTKGIIKYKYSNPDYKVRLEPEIILKEAKSLLER